MSWRPIRDTFEMCDWHPSLTRRENMPVALCWHSVWSYYGFHILSIIVCGRYWNRSVQVHLLIKTKGKALYCETVSCWLLIDAFSTARGVTCSKAEIWLLWNKYIFLSCTISIGSFNSDGDNTSENTWKSLESKQWRSFFIISGLLSTISLSLVVIEIAKY